MIDHRTVAGPGKELRHIIGVRHQAHQCRAYLSRTAKKPALRYSIHGFEPCEATGKKKWSMRDHRQDCRAETTGSKITALVLD
jgi:hypothetical protein